MMMRLATQTTSTEQGRNPDDDEISNTDHINRTRED
jgi:hypothetical protein